MFGEANLIDKDEVVLLAILLCTARGLFRTFAAMIAPCSVKA
jgi:hypothetical protein